MSNKQTSHKAVSQKSEETLEENVGLRSLMAVSKHLFLTLSATYCVGICQANAINLYRRASKFFGCDLISSFSV
jgi:hypothetical protein